MRLATSLLLVVFSTGCAVINATIPPPLAQVGNPQVFDGRRLLQEFSERRLQIDVEIKKASVEEIDTVGRVVSSSAATLGATVRGITDDSLVDRILDSDSTQAENNANQTELQNLYIDSLKADLASRQELVGFRAEREALIQEQARLEVERKNVLINYYQSILAVPDDPNDSDDDALRMDAADKLSMLSSTLEGINTEPTPDTLTLPGIGPDSVSREKITNADGLKKIEDFQDQATKSLSSLLEDAKKLSDANSLGSSRRAKFQQYQSYLDELYSQRNRYILDDGHRTYGRRLVRLVFPIYVPPSSSTGTTNVEFRIRDLKVRKDIVDLSNLQLDSLIKSLNNRAFDLDDNARRPLNLKETRSQSLKIYKDLISLRDGCVNTEPQYLVLEQEKSVIKTDKDYEKEVNGIWKALTSARKTGLSIVAGYCLEMDELPIVYDDDTPGSYLGWKSSSSTNPTDPKHFSDLDRSFRVYAMNPLIEREKIDQTISRIRQVGLSIGNQFGNNAALGQLSLDTGIQNQLLAQAASANPIVAGYQKNVENKNTKNRSAYHNNYFGWNIYPRFTITNSQKLVSKHIGTSFFGSVDVSLPVRTGEIELAVLVNGTELYQLSVALPALTVEELNANTSTEPFVDDTPDYGIVDPSKQFSVLIKGDNIWRNPSVFVGGRQHDNLEFISGSENNIRAVFKNLTGITCDYFHRNFNRTNTYREQPFDGEKYCAAEIWIHTTTGRDFAGSVVIERKAKKKEKEKEQSKPTGRFVRIDREDNAIFLKWIDAPNNGLVDGVPLVAVDTGELGSNKELNLKLSNAEILEEKKTYYIASGPDNIMFCRDASAKPRINCKVNLSLSGKIIATGTVNSEPVVASKK